MQATPFTLVAGSLLDAAQAALTPLVAAWARQWGLPADACSVSVLRAWDGVPAKSAGAWSACSGKGEGAAWLFVPAELCPALERSLFAPDGTYAPQGEGQASVAPAAARRACEALQDVLVQAVLPAALRAPGEAPAALWHRGSGAALVSVSVGKQACQVLLNGPALRALQGKAAPLSPLPALTTVDYRQAVGSTPVVLQLTIGAAQVSLGSLMSLAVGDVVRLDAGADAPVSMSTLGGTPVFDAYLGKVGDQVAVEAVIRHSTSFGAVK
jgi:hypothetical protein